MRRSAWVVLSAVACVGVLASPIGVAAAAPNPVVPVAGSGNPWGVSVVRFAPGTTPAAMYAAVRAAGGTVTNDLSPLNALAVVANPATFAGRIRANRSVKTLWLDRMYANGDPDAGTPSQGSTTPNVGPTTARPIPDPLHDATSFNGETNPEGILQWDDNRINVRPAWTKTTGDGSVVVAVIDTGIDYTHKELLANVDRMDTANTLPCRDIALFAGPGLDPKDCSKVDGDGHGTWVASRIAGAVNGFASNGIAPNVTVIGYKALSTTLGGGLTSWIVDAMLRACNAGADVINMSLGGYDDGTAPGDVDDFFLWLDAVNYCRAKGTAIFASAGNEHVRINRTTLTLTGSDGRTQAVPGLGQVDAGPQGIASILPGGTIAASDLRGRLETPAGVPGVVMVSATNNAIGAAPADVPAGVRWPAAQTGAKDQLTYYSSYGSRIDVAAPGGARKFNVPRVDGGPGDILYGGWGTLGALTEHGEICQDPSLGGPLTFSCFLLDHYAFGWLQGTSMSSPNAAGVAALVLSANHALQGHPDQLLARLTSTARTDMVNLMGPNDPVSTVPDFFGVPCPTAYCHVDFTHPISFSDAYGAGMVNAAAAVG